MRTEPRIVVIECPYHPCEHGDHERTYPVAGACSNCGQRAIALFAYGHQVMHGQQCPTCGCAALRWDVGAPAPTPPVDDPLPPARAWEQGELGMVAQAQPTKGI